MTVCSRRRQIGSSAQFSSFGGERAVDRDVDQVRGRPVLGEERDLLEVVDHCRELLRARGRPHELADGRMQREVGRVRERDVRRGEELDGLGQPKARRDFTPCEDLVQVCIWGVRDGLQRDLEGREVSVETAIQQL